MLLLIPVLGWAEKAAINTEKYKRFGWNTLGAASAANKGYAI